MTEQNKEKVKPTLKPEQEDVVYFEGGDLLVSASAGSGKTFVMIERIIDLILKGKAEIKNILAITFTEAAAKDMKDKLKRAIIDRINEDEKAGKSSPLKGQLAQFSTASVSTIDSFCMKLLRTYFFKAGVSADFGILDPDKADGLKSEAIDGVFDEYYKSKDEEFIKIARRHSQKRSDKEFKSLIIKMHEFCCSEEIFDTPFTNAIRFSESEANKTLLDTILKEVKNGADELLGKTLEIKEYFKSQGEEKYVKNLEEHVVSLNNIIKAEDIYKAAEFFKLPQTSLGSKEEYKFQREIFSNTKTEFKKTIDAVKKVLPTKEDEVKESEAVISHENKLREITLKFKDAFDEMKREENVLDFSDLESKALKVLCDEEVKAQVRSSYKYVFVDEYQDVNSVQDKIISKVSDGNLFMVGDLKQSIYAFRGCRSEFFAEKMETLGNGVGSVKTLQCNFRSSNAVIDAVNKVFSYCMDKDFYGLDYEGTSKLQPGGVYAEGYDGRVMLHLIDIPEEDKSVEKETPRIYDVLEKQKDRSATVTEAALIVKIIREELNGRYYNLKTKKEEPVTFKDIAILSRSTNTDYVRDMVQELIEMGLPVTTSTEVDITTFPEVKFLENVVSYIDCARQDLPLLSLLKSPVGKLTDEDVYDLLSEYKKAGEKPDALGGGLYRAYNNCLKNGEGEIAEKLKKFDKYFTDLRFLAEFLPASTILEKICDDFSLLSYFNMSEGGAERVKRMKRFIGAAVSGGRKITVREFASEIEKGLSLSASPSAGENSVNFMTIHASKGREFPVVIVCGTDKKTKKDASKSGVYSTRNYGFTLDVFDDEKRTKRSTVQKYIAKREHDAEDIRGEIRLLYVALTRAQYSLHITAFGNEETPSDAVAGKRFLDYFPQDFPRKVYGKEDFLIENTLREKQQVIFAEEDKEKTRKITENLNYVYPYADDCLTPLKTAVTRVIHGKEEYFVPQLFDEDEKEDGAVKTCKEGKSTSFTAEKGTAAHRFMELFDYGKRRDFDGEKNRILSTGEMTAEEIEKIDLSKIENALKSDLFDGIEEKTIYREKSFICNFSAGELGLKGSGTVVCQGVLDLLIVDKDNNAEIIDFKYSAKDEYSLKKEYEKQLELYAAALERSTDLKVKKKVILSLVTGKYVIL